MHVPPALFCCSASILPHILSLGTKKPPLGRRPWNKKRRFLHENEEVVLVLTTGKVFQPIASSFNRSLGVF